MLTLSFMAQLLNFKCAVLANNPSCAAVQPVIATASAEKLLLADTMLVRVAKNKCACMAFLAACKLCSTF